MNRREALKTAAITAPIIATLPCGAVMASGSSHICVSKAQESTNMGIVPKISTTADHWIRVMARKRVCKDGAYYHTLGEWYFQDGTKADKPSRGRVRPTKKDEKLHIALAFTPSSDLSKVDKVELNFKEFTPGTTALTGSCWTSISPNSVGLRPD